MILIIDNYDSFVFNIYQYVLEIYGENVKCVRNDEITINEIKILAPSHIILGPGPNHPKDSKICLEILNAAFNGELKMPILGVCLGHQAIGVVSGAEILRLKNPLHGKTSKLEILREKPLFLGLPNGFEVMRYHSLYIDENSLSSDFEILAKAKNDGVIMAIAYKKLPIYGIQFHPESYFTEYGKKILENFINFKI